MKINKDNLEYRIMKVTAAEQREESAESRMTIEGYAVLFDTPQTYQWGETTYTETISKGALDTCKLLVGLAFTAVGVALAYWKYNQKDIR